MIIKNKNSCLGDRNKILQGVIVVLIACVCTFNAQASTTSEMLRTQAILEMYEGKHDSALAKLEKAIEADKADYTAIYYRGIVRSRMGKYKEAIDDIKVATKSKIDFEGLHFELGFAHYLTKNFGDAQASLEKAHQLYPEHAPAKYYLGLTYYMQGRFQDCVAPLSAAAELDNEFGASSAYLIGDAYIKLKRYMLAKNVLTTALNDYPDSLYSSPTRDLLETISYKKEESKSYAASIKMGFARDSNVGLFPDGQILPGNKHVSDSRSTIDVNAAYKVFSQHNKTVKMGLQLFKNNHANLTEYDLSKYSGAMELLDRGKRLAWGLRYEISKTDLNVQKYQESKNYIPHLLFTHDRSLLSHVSFILRDTDYFLTGQELRSSNYYELMYRAYFLQNNSNKEKYYTGIKYQLNNAIDDEFDYRAYIAEGGYSTKTGEGVLDARAKYGVRDYFETAPMRTSQNATLSLKYSQLITKPMFVDVGVSYINNSSNDRAFDYTRTVMTMLLRWTL